MLKNELDEVGFDNVNKCYKIGLTWSILAYGTFIAYPPEGDVGSLSYSASLFNSGSIPSYTSTSSFCRFRCSFIRR